MTMPFPLPLHEAVSMHIAHCSSVAPPSLCWVGYALYGVARIFQGAGDFWVPSFRFFKGTWVLAGSVLCTPFPRCFGKTKQ